MKRFLALLAAAAMMLTAASAFAYSVKVDDDTFASVGTKAIIRYVMTNPDRDKVDVVVPNARVYFAGQVTNNFKFGFNYDMSRAAGGGQGTSLSDAFIMLDMAKEFKILTGIYRMAVSRVALQDTYQFILPNAPEVAAASHLSRGLASFRSGGITLWGDLADGMVRYNVGFWDGDFAAPEHLDVDPGNPGNQGDNPGDEIGISARVVFNFMDPEKGYTCPGCYLGKAKVANVGVGYLTQDYVLGTAENTYTVTTVDAFYDVDGITAEAAYFSYDYDTGYKPTAWYVEGAYVIGKLQPAVRYESWDADALPGAGDYTKLVAGVNYLIDGHNAKVSLAYENKDFDVNTSTVLDTDTFILQLQVQF